MRQASQPGRKLLPRKQLISAGNFLDTKRATGVVQQRVEPTDQGASLGAVFQLRKLGDFATGKGLTSEQKNRLQALRRLIPAASRQLPLCGGETRLSSFDKQRPPRTVP